MPEKIKHAAVLGGAFDPVTSGHMQIAELLLKHGERVDEVWIMPCYKHVFNKRMSSPAHRLAMCRIASAKIPDTKVIDYEIEKKFEAGTYYLMLDLLASDWVSGFYRLSLAIGLDNANGFEYWIQHERLMKLVNFIVIPRQGVASYPRIDWYKKAPHSYLDTGSQIMRVSSTEVRRLIKEKKYTEARALLDPDVLDYIIENGLYA